MHGSYEEKGTLHSEPWWHPAKETSSLTPSPAKVNSNIFGDFLSTHFQSSKLIHARGSTLMLRQHFLVASTVVIGHQTAGSDDLNKVGAHNYPGRRLFASSGNTQVEMRMSSPSSVQFSSYVYDLLLDRVEILWFPSKNHDLVPILEPKGSNNTLRAITPAVQVGRRFGHRKSYTTVSGRSCHTSQLSFMTVSDHRPHWSWVRRTRRLAQPAEQKKMY